MTSGVVLRQTSLTAFLPNTASRSFISSPPTPLNLPFNVPLNLRSKPSHDRKKPKQHVCRASAEGGNNSKLGGSVVLDKAAEKVGAALVETTDARLPVPGGISETGSKEEAGGVVRVVKTALGGVTERAVSSLVGLLYKEIDEENPILQGNFGPVSEVMRLTRVEVVEGQVPLDFPSGTYIRNGPNPYFDPKTLQSPTGRSAHHWFEGDGMLHGTYFEGGGKDGVWYANQYVDTEGLTLERKRQKRLFLPTVDCDQPSMIANALLNQARFGVGNKNSANTSIVHHNGQTFACQEGGLPHLVSVPELKTLGTHDFGGAWDRPFTAHPKVCPTTGEMVFFGFDVEEPYVVLGVLSASGKVIHKADLKLPRAVFMHDIAITPKYNVILDMPLTFSTKRLKEGKSLIDFERQSYAKVGIMPRFGTAESLRWFDVDLCFAFHTFNAYEDGDEVVLHAIRTREAVLKGPDGMSPKDYFAKALTPSPPNPNDPLAGTLSNHLYEWRFNLATGQVLERMLVPMEVLGDFPRINEQYVGKKYKYGYAAAVNLEACCKAGLPLYGGILKYHLPQSKTDAVPVKTEVHGFGEGRFGCEPVFVPRASAKAEDDGWVVTYVYDEKSDHSEMVIVDAQNFGGEPVARVRLPQRVPYGFHGAFIPAH